MSSSEWRTKEEWESLCTNVKTNVPVQIGSNAWEVIIVSANVILADRQHRKNTYDLPRTAAALIASPDHLLLGQFYTYLSENDSSFSGDDAKRRLSLRFRDVLLKSIILVGAPKVICNLAPLAKAEGEHADKAGKSMLNEKWKNMDVPTTHARGEKTVNTIYGSLLPGIFQTWGGHMQDMRFSMLYSVYGLYLSDTDTLTSLETEAVTFTAICCGGFKGPSLWHMRGMGRLLGARGTDEDTKEMREIKDMLRSLKVAMLSVVDWVGEEYVSRANIGSWANVGDVVRSLGGWGEDA